MGADCTSQGSMQVTAPFFFRAAMAPCHMVARKKNGGMVAWKKNGGMVAWKKNGGMEKEKKISIILFFQ